MEYSDLEIMDNTVDRPGGQHKLTVTCRLVVALLFVGVVVMVMSIYTVVIISDTHHTGQSDLEIMDNKVDRPGGQHKLTVTCRLVVALLFVGVVVMVMSIYTVVIISDTHHTGPSDSCSGAPCLNGGSCTQTGESFSCTCVGGYTGPTCGTDIDECRSGPCNNDGICINSVDQYVCVCPSGLTGHTCSEDIDDCDTRPCMNDGNCTDNGTNAFFCDCAAGYTGRTCATDIDECSSGPCQNGGECINSLASYRCVCLNGWTGSTCDETENLAPNEDIGQSSLGTTCDVSHTYDTYSCNQLLSGRGAWLSHEGPAGEWIILYFPTRRHVLSMDVLFSCSNMESCSDFTVIYSDGTTKKITRECVGIAGWGCTGNVALETFSLDKWTSSVKLLCNRRCGEAHDWRISDLKIWAVSQ